MTKYMMYIISPIYFPLLGIFSVLGGIIIGIIIKPIGIAQDWWHGVHSTYITWKCYPSVHYERYLSRQLAKRTNHEIRPIMWTPRDYWRQQYPDYPGFMGLILSQTGFDLVSVPFRVVSAILFLIGQFWQSGILFWKERTGGTTV